MRNVETLASDDATRTFLIRPDSCYIVDVQLATSLLYEILPIH